MKRQDAQPLTAIIDELLKTQNLDEKLYEVRLLNAWENVLGKSIADYTKEKYIKNKVLHVHVTSSILRNELMMSRQKLMEMLNKSAGKNVINDIFFR